MGKINKKIINIWDGGIKTSSRSSNPDTSDGAQMIKGFDVYKDPKKMIPMQSWEDFTTLDERKLGIRAMGGVSDRVYGLGNTQVNWYGKNWQYRLRIDVNQFHYLEAGLPIYLNMADLPQDFWDNVEEDMSDVRITDKNNNTYAVHTENVDYDLQTGDMWIKSGIVSPNTSTPLSMYSESGTGVYYPVGTAPDRYALAYPITFTGKKINKFTTSLRKIGIPTSDITVKLYTDNAGSPGTLYATLGTIPKEEIRISYFANYSFLFDEIQPTGTYWVVIHTALIEDASNYFDIQYSSSGTTTSKTAMNNSLTSWNNLDTTMTPNYTFTYIEPDNIDRYFYIYYGNQNTTAIPYGTPSINYTNGARNVFTGSSMRFAYSFADDKANNLYYNDNDTGQEEAFTTFPQVTENGLIGKAVRTLGTAISTDIDDEVCIQGNDISISFLIKVSSWANQTLLTDSNGNFTLALDVNGKINWTVNGTVATTTNTSTIALSLNEWHIIDCVFQDDAYIYIDGVKETFNIDDGNLDETKTDNILTINTGNIATIGQIWGFSTQLTQDKVSSKYNNFWKEDFYTIGSQEAQTNTAISYDGLGLYYKLISSGNWEEIEQSGQPIKSLSYYPVNAWIDDTATYFICSQEPENQGFLYMAMVDSINLLTPDYLLLSVLSTNSSNVSLSKEYVYGDGVTYFNYGTSAIGSVGNPGSSSETTFGGIVQSLASWRTYLAGAYTIRNRAILHIWDLSTTNPKDKIDVGTGNTRIVGTAGDTLFCVVDNFCDDTVKSTNKPTVEIRQYVGNVQSRKTHVLEVPKIITDYADNWEKAVSNMKFQRNTQTLFYMRLPKDDTGTTFNEGFWAIGKNSGDELCLTLQINTEGLGMPEQVFNFAQQVFFIKKDGGIKRLSDDTYSQSSLFKSLKMNEGNTKIEKKLYGFEVVTEPLEDGQTISLYYKRDGDTERTLVGTMTGEGEIAKEFLHDVNEEYFKNYKELEIEVESTGGKSAILEINYRYEYLND